MRPKEVFLSHASEDVEIARKIQEILTRHGIRVWLAPAQLRGGQEWHDQIGAALERCDWFLVLLSPAAVNSEWVKRELHFALNEPRYREHIVQLQYKDCEVKKLSWVLPQLEQVKFQRGDGNYEELLHIWDIEYLELDPALQQADVQRQTNDLKVLARPMSRRVEVFVRSDKSTDWYHQGGVSSGEMTLTCYFGNEQTKPGTAFFVLAMTTEEPVPNQAGKPTKSLPPHMTITNEARVIRN